MKESWRKPGRWFLYQWPSSQAKQPIGQKVKSILAPRFVLPFRQTDRVRLNPVLRG